MRSTAIAHGSNTAHNRSRGLGFLAFILTVLVVCVVFSDPVNDATMVPACVFCPWIRLLHQMGFVGESKGTVALITAIYSYALYLIGGYSGKRFYTFVLCMHTIAVCAALESISIGSLDTNLMIWGMIVAIPLSVLYYTLDIFLFMTAEKR